jgi:hypothetical protein
MPKYLISCCDGETCEELSAGTAESAKRKLAKAVRKRAKRFAKSKIPEGHVHGEVREVNRGVMADEALYVADEHYGAPTKRTRRRKAPKPTE